MEITKTKTTKYKVLQVGIDIMEFNERYKEIRSGAKYKGFKCFNCNTNFEIGEKISLIITNKGNKTVCHKCAESIHNELN